MLLIAERIYAIKIYKEWNQFHSSFINGSCFMEHYEKKQDGSSLLFTRGSKRLTNLRDQSHWPLEGGPNWSQNKGADSTQELPHFMLKADNHRTIFFFHNQSKDKHWNTTQLPHIRHCCRHGHWHTVLILKHRYR